MSVCKNLKGSFKLTEVYPVEALPMEVKASINSVLEARKKAYAPYSGFLVGAAIITESGKVITGSNNETINHDGYCAEATAIGNWNDAGAEKAAYIITAGAPNTGEPDANEFATPCGRCRQRLVERFDLETPIICLNQTFDSFRLFTPGFLLPFAFYPKCLV